MIQTRKPCDASFRAPHSAFKVSVIGLAPIRPDLKGRLRELLCIHGRWKNSKRQPPNSNNPVFKVATGAGIAPTPPGLQPGVQTDYTIQ